MEIEESVLRLLGILSLFGVFFWVSILLPARATPVMREGWRWLQWRPFPPWLPRWMGTGFLLGLVLQSLLILILPENALGMLPPGVVVLISIVLFQGLLTAVLFLCLHRARLHVPQVLGLESAFSLREMVAGFVGYCMALPLVALTSLLTAAVYGAMGWEVHAQPLLEEFQAVSGWMNWITLFVLVGFIGPLLEEVVFRGFLFAWLRQKLGVHAGLWIQAMVFGLIHQHGAGFLPLTALALVLGLAYVYTKRLMVCVWMHAFFNMMTLFNVVIVLETAAP